jgi:CRP-like cAMP-binding protein
MSNSLPDLNKSLTKAWLKASGLRSYSKILLLYLVYMEQYFQPVELTYKEIGEDVGMVYGQLRLAVRELRDKGLLEIKKAEGHRATIFKVNL